MLSEGHMFGRYAIVREIGRGGMGAVYEAEHSVLRKRVALKVMHEHAVDPRAIDRFVREGRAAASVNHRNVVTVIDLGVVEGRPFLVMELLRGEDLATTIARRAPLAVHEAVPWVIAVCGAVDALHQRGIVHRDLKPANIFLAVDDSGAVVPKVLDFGVCRDGHGFVVPSADSGLVGTPQYLSPEQVDGAPASPQSDQHALAAVLYEALVGHPAYGADTLLATLASIRDGRVRPLGERRGDLPEALCAVVHQALAVDPRDRFDSVRALASALEPFAVDRAAEPVSATRVRDGAATSSAAPSSSPDARTQRFGSPEPLLRASPRRVSRAPLITALALLGSLAAWAALARSRDAVSSPMQPRTTPPSTTVRLPAPPAVAPPLVAAPLTVVPAGREPAPSPARARHNARPARVEPPRAASTLVAQPAASAAINSAPILD